MGTVLGLLITLFSCVIAILAYPSSNHSSRSVKKILIVVSFLLFLAIIFYAVKAVQIDDFDLFPNRSEADKDIDKTVEETEENTEENTEEESEENTEEGSDENTVVETEENTNEEIETEISLEESNTIYDGYDYTYYKNSEADTFSLGSSSYKSGFTLYTYGYPRDNAYALFDLKGYYSKIRFDVGRVTGKSNLDAIMRVYLDDKHLKDYDLSADVVQ